MLEDRLQQTRELMEKIKESAKEVCTILWPNLMPPASIRTAARLLEEASKRIEESAARAAAGMARALVKADFPDTKGLEQVEEGAPVREDGKEVDVFALLPTFQAAASQIATFLDL